MSRIITSESGAQAKVTASGINKCERLTRIPENTISFASGSVTSGILLMPEQDLLQLGPLRTAFTYLFVTSHFVEKQEAVST
jgi:hypothetical protein